MPVKNLMEEIINSIVAEILSGEQDKISESISFKDDVIAYVLNRIPPRYFTSERGIIHGRLESKYLIQNKVDILFLVNEAINVIKSRRVSADHPDDSEIGKKTHFFPHILGEVFEETTFSVIPDVEATLTYKGNPVRMIDSGWNNPYITNTATKGYFHFWPDYNEDLMVKLDRVPFKIDFKHDKFEAKEVDIKLPVLNNLNTTNSQIMPVVLLRAKEGADVSYLYEE